MARCSHLCAVWQDKLDNQDAVFWPERKYPWGVSEAFNPQHSDLLHLRLLLLKEACDELSAAKRSRCSARLKESLDDTVLLLHGFDMHGITL